MAAGELGDEPLDVPPPGEREGGHLEPHGPTLGALLQRLDVGGRERQAHRLVQEVGGLLGGEAEIAGAQLGELAPGAQPREAERRVHPRGDHQVQARRQPVEQELQGPVDRRAVDGVIVVEHQHEIVGRGVDLVQQPGQDRLQLLRIRALRVPQHGQGILAQAGLELA